MSITLEAIKAEQSKVNEMIAAFERQSQSTTFELAAATISLAPGERYAGIILGEDGEPAHHLVLLPGDMDGGNWADAKSWAAERGGELPTRREQSLLFANLKGEFESAWYWSSQEHKDGTAYAWCQIFGGGYQGYYRKGVNICRARAVRRCIRTC